MKYPIKGMKVSIKKWITRWVYQNDAELINSPIRKNMDYFILQIIFANAFAILTGGEFLSGFAIYLGASDTLVGYIPLIGGISGISLVFSGMIMERFNKRRKLVALFNTMVKALLASIVLIPLFIPKSAQVATLFTILFLAYTLNSLLGLAVNSWFIKVIPIKIRGRYFSIRQIYAVLVMVLLPVIGGRILDMTPSLYLGFLILFAGAFIFGLGESYAFSKIDDVVMESMGRDMNFLDVFTIPPKNKEFMGYVTKNTLFHLALYLSASFTQVYMLRYLKLSYTFITSMTMLNAIIQIFAYSQWGKVGDRYGHSFVMELSYWFYALQMALWAMVSRETMYICIPLVYIVSSFSNSGFLVGSFNYRYEIIPEKGRSFYDAFYSGVTGITLLLAPWIGGKLMTLLGDIAFVRENIEFGSFRLTFALSALGLGLLSIGRLVKKKLNNKSTA